MSGSEAMRIVHIVSAPTVGGAEIYVRNLALEARRRGHHVLVLFLQHAVQIGGLEDVERDFLVRLDEGGVVYDFIGQPTRRLSLHGLLMLRTQLRKFKADIVHAHLFAAVALCAFTRVPVVYTRHGIGLRMPRLFYTLIMDRIVDAYVGICLACTRALESVTRGKPVVCIANGAEIGERVLGQGGEYTGDGSFVFLAVGRLNHFKNYPLLLKALDRLPKDRDWQAWIAGDGEERAKLIALTKELGLSERVKFLGNVSDVRALMCQAHAFVMSSKSEGLPISLLEATHACLPVVVTNVGGCAEVLHAVGNGLVVDDQSPFVFSKALLRMLEDSDLRRFFRRNAALYGGVYTLDAAVESHLSLYADLVGGRSSMERRTKDAAV